MSQNPFGGGDLPFDLSALFAQVQSMFSDFEGPINWPAATDLARKTAAQTPDPTPSAGQSAAVSDALRLADLWIDGTTSFPSGVQTAQAWSKADWLVNTFDIWHGLITPVAASSVVVTTGASSSGSSHPGGRPASDQPTPSPAGGIAATGGAAVCIRPTSTTDRSPRSLSSRCTPRMV